MNRLSFISKIHDKDEREKQMVQPFVQGFP